MMSGLREHKTVLHKDNNNFRYMNCMYFHLSTQGGTVKHALQSEATLLS